MNYRIIKLFKLFYVDWLFLIILGCRILPGLHESHIHVKAIGLSARRLSLEGCDSIPNLQQKLKRHAEDNPGSNWIIGDKVGNRQIYYPRPTIITISAK